MKAYEDRFQQLRTANESDIPSLLSNPLVLEKPKGGRARAPSPANPDPTGQLAELEASDFQEETSIGIDGQVYFYGRTSLYHIDPQKTPRDEARDDSNLGYGSNTRPEEQNEMAAFLAEISPGMLHELLATYWCWPHHLHCVLVKKVFLRAYNTRWNFMLCPLTQVARRFTYSWPVRFAFSSKRCAVASCSVFVTTRRKRCRRTLCKTCPRSSRQGY